MLRFQSAIQIESLPDEQIDSQFEVMMPTLYLSEEQRSTALSGSWTSASGIWNNITTLGANMVSAYTPIVEEISFGVRNFGTNTRRVRTGWCNVPDDIKNYQDVSITFFCSSGMLIQYYLEAWKRLIFNDKGEYYNPMRMYKKDIEVYFYGPGNINLGVGGLAAAHYTLKGCFPYLQDDYRLKYSMDPKRLTLTAKFRMDAIVFDKQLKTKSMIAEMVTSPSSILTQALDGFTLKGDSVTNIADIYTDS